MAVVLAPDICFSQRLVMHTHMHQQESGEWDRMSCSVAYNTGGTYSYDKVHLVNVQA